ncbi:MAG TPA: fasciclin domain-containing protein [Methanomassiliicoccales archaeon]|jgi:uncharacterized surface protein with fasciclin (FAS1) repeats
MKNIYDTLKENGNFTTLVEAIDIAGLRDTFVRGGDFTLFAPSDEAFAGALKEKMDELLRDRNSAAELVKGHTMNGKHKADTIRSGVKLQNGGWINADRSEGLRIGEALAVQPDIECDNGVVHVIDRVLMPEMVIA